jgi:hypothetical protein
MRNLLLAATAMIGATAGIANAQVVPPAVVVTPPPAPGFSPPSQTPQPGTAVVRLNARVTADFMVGNDSGNGYRLTSSNGNSLTGVAAKVQPYYFGEYARLYPAFDGVTANGFKYGGAIEVRQNSGGTGVNNAPANNAGSAGNTLFFRRETGYVGTDQLGTFRFGQTDGVMGLFLVGTFENFDYEGGWNGDLPALFSPAAQLPWVFTDSSAYYTTSKLIYLSPNFAGFDFGIDWEPSSNQTSGDGACAGTNSSTVITSGCATVSSISGPVFATIQPDLQRRRNQTTIMARYRGAFGPVGLVVQGGWIQSGSVADGNSGIDPVYYNGNNFGDGGAVLTFGGLAVGGHIDGGVKNGTALLPKGGKHELIFSTGFSYAFGPFIAGVQFINETFQGAFNGNNVTGAKNTYGLEHDIGLSVGATYDWAPGSSLYFDYLWGTRHQANRDFFAATTGRFNNSTRAQGAIIGQSFRW